MSTSLFWNILFWYDENEIWIYPYKKIKDFVNNVIEVKADKSRYKVNPEENINNLFVK